MGKGVEIAKALVSPAKKLIDCVSKACGKLYEPIHIKRIAKANAFTIKTIQETIENNPQLAQAYNSGMIQIDNKELNGLAIRSFERSLYQEMVKQQNLESVVAKAFGLLEGEPDVTDEPVGQDWMAQFVNSIETVSDEDMQLLWAKVLAGEIKTPKTYSLRTLESLKNLSKEEAILFQKFCKYVITNDNNSFFVNEENLLDKRGITVEILLKLSDCGIITYTSSLFNEYEIKVGEQEIIHNDEIAIVCRNCSMQAQIMTIKIYVLTNFGQQLISIINKNTSNEFLLELAKYLKNSFSNIEIKVHKITSRVGMDINFDESVDLMID